MKDLTNRFGLKKKMLLTCIEIQTALIENFSTRLRALLQPEGLGNEESYDIQDLSVTSMKVEEAEGINEALDFAKSEMQLLAQLETNLPAVCKEVTTGAVVITDKAKFFVCTSIEDFEVDGESYIGLSTHSPLYLSMKEKKKGDTFSYHGQVYHIADLF